RRSDGLLLSGSRGRVFLLSRSRGRERSLRRGGLARGGGPLPRHRFPRRLVVHLPDRDQFVQEVPCPFLRFVERLLQLMVALQLGQHLRVMRLPVLENHLVWLLKT